MAGEIRSVSWLNDYVAGLLDRDQALGELRVEGEISGGRVAPSGHYYFTLKDRRSQVSCVLFGLQNKRLGFTPQDGMAVIASGRAVLYTAGGRFQLNLTFLEEAGRGTLYARFLALKEKLNAEGLFAGERKKPLPFLPSAIGVVTSAGGAVLHDIIHVLRQRWPGFELLVYPVHVQGQLAATEIAAAIRQANRDRQTDVLIVGRGGGSFEDLAAFNEEIVVRAIAESALPIVAAVGHETDVTLADFAADYTAPTPTAAAVAVVPEQTRLVARRAELKARMDAALEQALDRRRARLQELASRPVLQEAVRILEPFRQQLDSRQEKLRSVLTFGLERARHRLEALAQRLDDLGPEKVLARGYSLVFDADGHVVDGKHQLHVGQDVRLRFQDGEATARITSPGGN